MVLAHRASYAKKTLARQVIPLALGYRTALLSRPGKRRSLDGFWQVHVGHSVKDIKWFLGYTRTIIQYLNHIELSTCK